MRLAISPLFVLRVFVAGLLLALAPAHAAASDCYPGPSECLGMLHQGQSYGNSQDETLDLYVPQAGSGTRPLIIFAHGGGFGGGDKSKLWPGLIRALLSANYAVASVNYRLVPLVRYPQPMQDVQRAIEFLRRQATVFRVDANRPVLSGTSAGGGIALWIALRDDPGRGAIAGAIVINAQTTYDPEEISAIFDTRRYPAFLARFFGITNSELSSRDPGLRRMFRDASASTHLDTRDPPVVLIYTTPDALLPSDAGPDAYLHHPRFGEFLKNKAAAVGADVQIRSRIGGGPGSAAFNRIFIEDVDRIVNAAGTRAAAAGRVR